MKSIVFLLFFCGLHQTFAQELTFNVKVSADTVAIGSTINVTFNLENNGNTLNFVPPDWNAAKFDVRSSGQSSSMTMSNGQYKTTAAYQYVVMPRDTGRLIIPSGTVKGKNSEIKTEPVNIVVTGIPNEYIQLRPERNQPELQAVPDKKKKIKTIRI